MLELRKWGILSIALAIILGNAAAYPKYVNDFVFPSDDENDNQRLPLWEPITYNDNGESNNYGEPHGQWVVSDIKDLDKCRHLKIVRSSGRVRLIYISYKAVADPLESLKEALVDDLNFPELINNIKIIKKGRLRLVFEVPNAIYAILILQSYCHLHNVSHGLSYEILSAEEDY